MKLPLKSLLLSRISKNFKIPLLFLSFFLLFFPFGISLREYTVFILLMLLFVFFPGKMILDWLKIKAEKALSLNLILASGLVSSILMAKFSRLIGAEFLFFLWLSLGFLWWLQSTLRSSSPVSSTLSLDSSLSWKLSLILIFASFLAILVADNFYNGLILPSGELALRMRFYDGFLRIACIRELAHSFPPQMPFASGNFLSYHYGMDLFLSLFLRYGQLDVFDLSHRLGLTFFAFLFISSLSLFLRSLLRTRTMATFGSFLLLFGSGGLAYLFSAIFRAPFTGNIFFNFYFHDLISLNSLLPGLALFFSGLLALNLYEKEKNKSWLWLAGLFLAAIFEFKVFLLVPIAGGLALATLIQFLIKKNKKTLPITLITALFSLPLLATALVSGRGAMGYHFRIGPVDWISHVLRELRLEKWWASWQSLISGRENNLNAYLIAAASVAIFIIGTFGLSLFGLPRAFRSLLHPSPTQSFLSACFLVSMATFFGITPYLGRLNRNLLNIYIYYLGLIVLAIFFLLELEERITPGKRTKKIIVLSLVGLLSLPNTFFYLQSRLSRPEIRLFSRPFLEAASWVEKNAPPEAVILHPSDMRYICYFAGRRVVLDNSIHSYLPFHLPQRKIRERLADVDRFFNAPENNLDVLWKYNVNYIWIDRQRNLGAQKDEDGRIILQPEALSSPFFSNKVILFPVFANEEHVIYQVSTEK